MDLQKQGEIFIPVFCISCRNITLYLLDLFAQDHGMFSATAALGLIHMWDVDGGLASIDKLVKKIRQDINV